MHGRQILHFLIIGPLACLILTAVAWLAITLWNFNKPPFPLARLEQLQPGMTTNDVSRILGPPTTASLHSNALGGLSPEWTYSRRGSWPIVRLFFATNSTLLRHDFDR